jgi:ribose transport system substrate-binding protein
MRRSTVKIFKNRNLARSAVVATAVVGLLALAGCSSTNGTGGTATKSKVDITTGTVGTMADFHTIASVCGTKSVTVGVVDGGGTNAWSKTVKAEIDAEAAKCPAIKSVQYAAGAFNLQATTSAITSFAAKGDKIILVIPDGGPGAAQLPAIRTATKAGSIVVPFASDPTGKSGVDYLDYTDQSSEHSGESWANWMVKQLGSKGGNVVFLGGPAGNNVSSEEFIGVTKVLKANPQITLLNPSAPITTNWDPAVAQTAMTGLLSKYPKIDGVITDYGATADGVIRAYQAAGKSLVPLTSTDENALSCGFDALKATNPDYALATVSSRTWIGRVALRKALGEFEGKSDTEPSIYDLALYEDSTGSTAGSIAPDKACLTGAPADTPPSTLLTKAQIASTFGS